MTLPFDNDRKKKWQCFVCGKEQKTYLDFRDHITESHEEGREFLLCPRCEAPVRDLVMHFRAKHPGWALPKGCQQKATVWCDFSGSRKRRAPGMRFREGCFVSAKNGKEMHYRSGMECSTYEILEELAEVVGYSVEPIEIPYLHEGQWRKYRPDLSVSFADGRREIWEVKPGAQTALPVNDAKWSHAQLFCEAKGWGFLVLTEVGLGRLKKRAEASRRGG